MTNAAEPAADDVKGVNLPDLATRIEWFEDWEESTRDAQRLARRDRAYCDGDQWSADDLEKLKARHQPPLVKNRIKRKIDFLLGEEIRKRVDPSARPRTRQHEDGARAMTDALRYVEEQQKFDQTKTAVAKNVFVEGYGGALKEIEACECDDGTIEYKNRLRHIEWDRLFYDPHSRALDFSDAMYRGVVLWMDLDDAIAANPDAEEALKAAVTRDIGEPGATTEDSPRRWVDRKRERVKIVELYFRVGKDWYRSTFTQGADIEPPTRVEILDEKGKYSVCPLIMASCYVDQDGNRYGVVRQMISPQDEINKRASKALHLLSVNQAFGAEGVVPDPTKFQTELAKPDGGYFELAPGWKTNGDLEIIRNSDLAQGHITLMQQAIQDIDSIGPSSSTLPDLPDSASGRAFLARQQAAAQEMGTAFDSLRSWSLSVYELDYLCVRQYWTEEMWLRVTDDQELTGYRFVALNREMSRAERFAELQKKGSPVPKALESAAGQYAPIVMRDVQRQHQMMAQRAQALGQPPPQGDDHMVQMIAAHPLMAETFKDNDVESLLMDIVLDEAPESAVLQDEQFEKWTNVVPALMQGGLDPREAAKITVELSQFNDKRRVLEVLSKPPDQKAAKQAEMAQQAQMATLQANLQIAQANAQKSQADAQRAMAQSQVSTNDAQLRAAQATKTAAEAQLVVPATARREMAQAAKLEAEIGKVAAETQLQIPASARREMSQADKLDSEREITVLVPDGAGPQHGGI